MSRSKPGRTLLLVIAAVVAITIAAPTLFDGLDNRVGSYVMVAVTLFGLAVFAFSRLRRR